MVKNKKENLLNYELLPNYFRSKTEKCIYSNSISTEHEKQWIEDIFRRLFKTLSNIYDGAVSTK